MKNECIDITKGCETRESHKTIQDIIRKYVNEKD